MGTVVYVRSVKAKMRKFKVISFDKETKLLVAEAPSGIRFEYPNFTKAEADRLGYELVKEEVKEEVA